MSERYKTPLPKQCTYTHKEMDYGHTHYCHVQWIDPDDSDVPYNVVSEWFGPRCSTVQLESQGYLKMLKFIRDEHGPDDDDS